ncbi:hypothetical protein KC717_03320 [Candidatus Dojkabacteria bacterium]|uniref:DUF1648 domain-containing protein n=1 Tax=Candidatus Dojkabacteria bacterium TaxID=2099670 RepID=A0A955L8M9_9BACT|nr:hypothetical protein [Candidatus Dojkabacteria bacterium]
MKKNLFKTNTLLTISVVATLIVSIPIAVYLYYLVFPFTPAYVTHTGPLWYWPNSIVIPLAIYLLCYSICLPITVAMSGFYKYKKTRSKPNLFLQLAIAIGVFLWGIVNLFTFLHIST